MPPLVFASRNRKKAVEITDLLQPHGIELLSVDDFPAAPKVDERGVTFAENAAQKAAETALAIGRWTLADDSGLEVDALDGKPGVHSARYAGPAATDAENNAKLLRALTRVPGDLRTARFVCHLAVANPAGAVLLSVAGHCEGRIVAENRGGQGFGYDPYFLIPDLGRTFGELPLEVKSQISHRANACRRLIPQLLALFESL